jgi:hypothetical protein
MKNIKILWLLLLFGCTRGCTTCTRIIDSETQTRNVNGAEASITAQKIKVTRAFLDRVRFGNIKNEFPIQLDIHSSNSYCFNYLLTLEGRPPIEVSAQMSIDESTDMQVAFSALHLLASSDKKHYASFIEGQFVEVYCFLPQGPPFAVPLEGVQSPESFPWEKLKPPVKWATELIEGQSEMLLSGPQRNTLIESLRAQAPGNTLDFVLLKHFPEKDLTEYVIREERIGQIAQASPEWKKLALEKADHLLQVSLFYGNALDLIFGLKDTALFAKADGLLLPKWLVREDGAEQVHVYAERRYPSLPGPMQQALLQKALAEMQKPNEVWYWERAADLLLKHAPHQMPAIEQGIALMLASEKYRQEEEVREAADNYIFALYAQLSDKSKVALVQHCKQWIDKSASFVERRRYFGFLSDKIDCNALLALRQKHLDDLQHESLPQGCVAPEVKAQ